MSTGTLTIENVDLDLLDKQRLSLISVLWKIEGVTMEEVTPEEKKSLEGLLNILVRMSI